MNLIKSEIFFYFLGVEYHCLASLARFFLFLFRLFNQNPFRSVAIRFLSNTSDKPRCFFMTNYADSFMLHVSLWHQLIRMCVLYDEISAQ